MGFNDISRNTDPFTSQLGAVEVTTSGRRESHKARILRALRSAPERGMIMTEVSISTGLEEPQVWRRLSDLKNDGMIEQRGEAQMGNSGMQGIWYLTEECPIR